MRQLRTPSPAKIQTAVYLPERLYERLVEMAHQQNKSRNRLIAEMLSEKVGVKLEGGGQRDTLP